MPDGTSIDERSGVADGPSGRIAKTERSRHEERVETADAGDAGENWEVFQRDDDGRPMRYVGRVRATSASEAHQQASRLFAWYAPEVWVCPAAAVVRFSTAGDGDETATPPSGDEPRTIEF
ncbi:hypothetical protein Halar_1520 [halophilic archaeon DL31]|jgi:rSAM-partnered protein|nr:hypothetical protein Halar_1520 [halophilic archaeon DL31]